MNDVRKMVFGAIIGLLLVLGLMFSIVYVSSCGLTFTCGQAEPKINRTPIPTLIPASHSESQMSDEGMVGFNKCQVNAVDLIGAWVSAGTPEIGPFPFTDLNGASCEGRYIGDIQPLFVENSLWKTGTLGCVSCHNADLTERSMGLDLSSYKAVLLGSRRVAGSTSKGNELLGNGEWEKSVLYDVLVNQALIPEGHSAAAPASELILFAGQKVISTVTTTPTP